jgi:hypothetical protein
MALAFILIALLVVTSSRAAFVAQSDNVANSVSTPSILLSDNDTTTAMFTVPDLVPGQVTDRCIDVTYAGSADPTQVSLFSAGTPTGTLASYLNLSIEYAPDTTDAFGSCASFPLAGTDVYSSGTLSGFATTHTTHDNSLTMWDPPAGTQTMTFRFRISVQDVTAAANKTTTFGFTWETRTS